MKVIIAGSRHCQDYALVVQAIEQSNFNITEIVVGGAKGVDYLAECWAEDEYIECTVFEADWSRGRYAGPKRNRAMALYADALILIWDGQSSGSASMLKEARKCGLQVEQTMLKNDAPSLF